MQKCFISALVGLLIAACSNDSILEGISDDDCYASKIEQAASDLDSGAYDLVIDELSVFYNTTTSPNPEVGRLIASAYMGKAGINITDLILVVSNRMGIQPFDLITSMVTPTKVYSINANFIKGDDVTASLGSVISAQHALKALVNTGMATSNDYLQLGVASAVHFFMSVGKNTADAMASSDFGPGTFLVSVNSYGYQYYATSDDYKSYWTRVSPEDFSNSNDSGPSPYQEDLVNINKAIQAISYTYQDANVLKDALDEYLHSVLGVSLDVAITDELILSYTSTGIYEFVQRLATQ